MQLMAKSMVNDEQPPMYSDMSFCRASEASVDSETASTAASKISCEEFS
jgi:hypothetical protein